MPRRANHISYPWGAQNRITITSCPVPLVSLACACSVLNDRFRSPVLLGLGAGLGDAAATVAFHAAALGAAPGAPGVPGSPEASATSTAGSSARWLSRAANGHRPRGLARIPRALHRVLTRVRGGGALDDAQGGDGGGDGDSGDDDDVGDDDDDLVAGGATAAASSAAAGFGDGGLEDDDLGDEDDLDEDDGFGDLSDVAVAPLRLEEGFLDRALRLFQDTGQLAGGLHESVTGLHPAARFVVGNRE